MNSRDKKLKRALDAVRAHCAYEERLARDPVSVVHRYNAHCDQELVGLVAASIAFGNVTSVRAKLDDLLTRLGPSPSSAADDESTLMARLRDWTHRIYRGEDVARLLSGARKVQRANGSLGAFFEERFSKTGDFRETLAQLCDAVRDAGGFPSADRTSAGSSGRDRGQWGARRGPIHLLPDVRGAGGSKRLLLFLRWMIRPADGIDLGLWKIAPRHLRIPVDTHIHKLGRNLGLTQRASVSWETAEEITKALARIHPEDPVSYDFSLCHLGMLQRCPSRRDLKLCNGCGVQPVCRHW